MTILEFWRWHLLEHWEFYIIPTFRINELCKDSKTISLSRVKKMTDKVFYKDLKLQVDKLIDNWDDAL